jgi:hopanoid biosynthesis associated RND transporter like protein HpnN
VSDSGDDSLRHPRDRGAWRLGVWIARLVAACERRAIAVAVGAGLLAAAALAYTATHFAIDTDTAKLIDEDVPWRAREAAFAASFPHRVDLIAIVVDGATPESAEYAAASLTARLAGERDAFHAVWRPDGGAFFDRAGLLFESTQALAATTERLIAAQPLLGTLAADPTLRGLMDALALVAGGAGEQPGAADALVQPLDALAGAFEALAAGTTPAFSWRTLFTGAAAQPRELRRFVLAQPILDYAALQPGARATERIRAAVRELGIAGDAEVRVRLTGPVPLADEEFATLAEGGVLNAAAMTVTLVALLWAALRSWRLIVGVLASLGVGLAVTAAFGLAAFGAYNLISVAFAILFVGLGVDFGIQYCVAYRARRHGVDDLRLALHDAGERVGPALALAAAATAAGFYAFVPTAYRGVSELGLIAGTGMIVALVTSITLLPALVALLRPPGEPAAVGFAPLAPLDRLLVRRRRWVLAASALVAAGSLALLPRLAFDFNPLHLRSPDVESVATLLDLMQDASTSPDTIDVLAPSIGAAQALARRLEQLPQVDHTLTVASFVPEQQDEKLALIADAALLLGPALDPPARRPAPSDAETVVAIRRAQAQLEGAAAAHADEPFGAAATRLAGALKTLAGGPVELRARARDALIPGLGVTLAQLRTAMQAQPVTLASLPRTITRDWVTDDGRARVEIYPKGDVGDDAALRRYVAAVQSIAPDATGAPVSIVASSGTIVAAFAQAGAWALLSITVLLAVALRRAAAVGLTLLPLALSALGTLATCVVAGVPLNFENIIALPLLFGIGVAFNIYYVMAWAAGRDNPLQSSLTRAVVMSGLTTGMAFGSLWLSHHPGTSSMGKLLAISLAWTLASALLFLPALLARRRA